MFHKKWLRKMYLSKPFGVQKSNILVLTSSFMENTVEEKEINKPQRKRRKFKIKVKRSWDRRKKKYLLRAKDHLRSSSIVSSYQWQSCWLEWRVWLGDVSLWISGKPVPNMISTTSPISKVKKQSQRREPKGKERELEWEREEY